jgi:hypothetical protein
MTPGSDAGDKTGAMFAAIDAKDAKAFVGFLTRGYSQRDRRLFRHDCRLLS